MGAYQYHIDAPLQEPEEHFETFVSTIKTMIYDTMFLEIRNKLRDLPQWPVWNSESKLSQLRLPSFSLQPSETMTQVCRTAQKAVIFNPGIGSHKIFIIYTCAFMQVGEHLLTLVQQLEPFTKAAEDEGDDEGDQDEGEIIR